jgi:hypothetical protein
MLMSGEITEIPEVMDGAVDPHLDGDLAPGLVEIGSIRGHHHLVLDIVTAVRSAGDWIELPDRYMQRLFLAIFSFYS